MKFILPIFIVLLVVTGVLGFLLFKANGQQIDVSQLIEPQSQDEPSDVELEQPADYSNVYSLGIPMLPVEPSTQSGSASLIGTDDGKLNVSLDVTAGETTQSAFLKVGVCPKPESSEINADFELSAVEGGKSETVVDTDLQYLLTAYSYAVVIQNPDGTITSCGDIKAAE